MTGHDALQESPREVIGLLPAAGQARRIAPLPCSKELYPVGFRHVDGDRGVRPKVACHYLLEKMRLADITKAYIVLRKGKWDIPAYLGGGAMMDMALAYLMTGSDLGVPYTLDEAFPFLGSALVAFGFPDVVFRPDDAFVQLLSRQRRAEADVVLGLLPAHRPTDVDMVDLDEGGRVRTIVIKPLHTKLHYTWVFAVWTPVFTRFMHNHLARGRPRETRRLAKTHAAEPRELSVGDVLQAAISSGVHVNAVRFPHNTFLDIGTPEDLVKASKPLT